MVFCLALFTSVCAIIFMEIFKTKMYTNIFGYTTSLIIKVINYIITNHLLKMKPSIRF